jgi:predicted permease
LSKLFADVKFVLRSLCRNPLFVLVALTSLALGIGANSAIFSLMDQVMLRSLPVQKPEQIVMLDWKGSFQGRMMNDHAFAYPMYKALRDQSGAVMSGLVARFRSTVDVQEGSNAATRADAELVSGNYFQVLGVRAALGRLLSPQDDQVRDGSPYAVLSYGLWESKFGGDSNILNRVILVNGHPFNVVGVAQQGFRGFEVGSNVGVFVPMMMKKQVTPLWDDIDNRRSVWLNIFGRLKPGVSRDQSQANLAVAYHNQLADELKEMPKVGAKFRERYVKNEFKVLPAGNGFSDLRDQTRKPLIVLMVMVGVLLLIACGNIANLLVARAVTRQKEISIRLSIGASAWEIIRLVLVESVMLSLCGGILGLLVAQSFGKYLLGALPFPDANQVFTAAPDVRVILFTLGVSLLTAVIFGLLPALRATNPDLFTTLKNAAGSVSASGGQIRLRKALVVAQITLSLLLLVGAGLFARSLNKLMGLYPGLNTQGILTFSIDPTLSSYTPARIYDLHKKLVADLRSVPGVTSVSVAENGILSRNFSMSTTQAEGYQVKEDDPSYNPEVNQITPGFFATLGVPLIGGRDFTERDVAGAQKVAVLSQPCVDHFFKNRSPLGRKIGFNGENKGLDIEVVGVVREAKLTDLKQKPTCYVFTPLLQDMNPGQSTFYVRTASDDANLASSVRAAVAHFDPALPIFDVKTLETQTNETHYVDRMVAFLSAAFGLLATLLAAVGLYGVMSYSVTRRTREIGIRMALGSKPSGVLWNVLSEVLVLAGVGIAVALPLVFLLSRYLESQLYEVKALDPMAIGFSTLVLAFVSVVAGWIPAYRATRVDPLTALRYE